MLASRVAPAAIAVALLAAAFTAAGPAVAQQVPQQVELPPQLTLDQSIQIVGDDAYRGEIHQPSSFGWLGDETLRYRSVAKIVNEATPMAPKRSNGRQQIRTSPALRSPMRRRQRDLIRRSSHW